MNERLKVLIVEDSEDHALLLLRHLKKGGYDPFFKRVDNSKDMQEALHNEKWDVIVADHQMPQFSAPAALKILKESQMDYPFIIVSGTIGEEIAVDAMKAGASDYITKGNLSRLVPAIERELKEVEVRRERKIAKEALRMSEEKFHALFHNSNDLICVFKIAEGNRPGNFIEVNDVACRKLGFTRDEFFNLNPLDIEPRDMDNGIRREYENLLLEGCCSYETEILTKQKDRIPLEVSTHIFNLKGIKVALSMGRDVTERKKAENELKESLEKTTQAMEGIILVTAKTLELRDPYTAGHQRSVSKIACAIAREMGLSNIEIEGIHLACQIHDLGKIYVPAEILSKPGKISDLEFEMIRTHPQRAYDILKMIDFPWPIAQIVSQHHERIDGSGYPLGLSGDDISPGARILGVADVLEAMASHRPYRPALGLNKAMEEIMGNKGELYDYDVVEACLKVLSRKDFDIFE